MLVPTEGHLGYEHVLDQIHLLINQLIAGSGISPTKIGIGTPGTLDPILGEMKNCNSTSLNGKNLKADLESKTGITFVLSNDANCFAVAETKMGVIVEEMPNAEVVFGVILGTGVGGGLVVNGKVIGGRQGIGGIVAKRVVSRRSYPALRWSDTTGRSAARPKTLKK